IDASPTRTFPVVIEELGARHDAAAALLSHHESFSHAELAAQANRYARWALAAGVEKGDVVALVMGNRPEYLAIWLGITRVGGVVALINTNLGGPSLAHCIAVARPKHVIVSEALAGNLDGVEPGIKVWHHGAAFSRAIAAFGGTALSIDEIRFVTL